MRMHFNVWRSDSRMSGHWKLLWLILWGEHSRRGIAISHRKDMLYSARNIDRSLHIGGGRHICFPGWKKAGQ